MSDEEIRVREAAPAGAKQLEAGLYAVGLIRGVITREIVKRETGEVMRFPLLVVEGEDFSTQRWDLTKNQKDMNWPVELDRMVGKKCLIPVSVTKNKDFVNYRLRGDSLPVPVK